MMIRGFSLYSRLAAVIAMLFALTACGGGGGGEGGFIPETNELQLTLFGPDGERTNIVSVTKPGTLEVRVKGDNKRGVVVSVNSTLGTLTPATGTALTDDRGIATFLIEAGAERGAGTINATAEVNGDNITGSLGFQVGETGFRIGFFDDDGMFVEGAVKIEPESTLAAGGSAQLSVVVLDPDGNLVTSVEEVIFSSGCIAAGQSAINPESPVSTLNSRASTLYSAGNCSGQDDITASLVGTNAQAFGNLTVAPASANAVLFVSAEPELIVLRGTGGQNRDETSEVIFQVNDGIGQPLPGVTVNFALNTEVGGISLNTTSGLTNGEGQVTVIVSSGDVATTVRVIATIDDGSGNPLGTVSDLLTVTTGLPDQNSISLAVSDTFVVENGMRTDGVTRAFTVSMADKFNNPVVDGTAAVFTTEYGAIVGSCTTTEGTCSVQWRSQEPRFPTLTDNIFVKTIFDDDYDCPTHNGNSGPCEADLGQIRGGRSAVLVHALGEESFIDRNGNGIMDQDEAALFDNLPEAFIDYNDDGVYTPVLPECIANPQGSLQCISGQEEIFVDINSNNEYDTNDDPAVYNGLLCPPEGDGVWCSRNLVHVFASSIVMLSDAPSWDIILLDGNRVVNTTEHGVLHRALIADTYNTPPPGGSTVAVSVTGDCKLLSESSFTVPNFSSTRAYSIPVRTDFPDEFTDEPGILRIRLDAVGGTSFTRDFDCDGSRPDPIDECAISPQPPECIDPNSP